MTARSPEQVQVFMTGRPQRPFTEVGIIESQQESALSEDSPEEIVQKMREFAAESGCDALTIFSGNNDTVVTGGKDSASSHTLLGYRGACLVYTTASAEAPRRAKPNSCMPNTTLLCYGPGGCRGAQRCVEDGQSYTLCDCGQQSAQAQ